MRFASKSLVRGLAVGGLSALFLLLPLRATAFAAERGHGGDDRAVVYARPYVGWGWGARWGWGPGWGLGWGPGWGWGWGWNQPYWYYQYHTGEIKLENVNNKDQVYVNGAFAGKAGDLKTMRLSPGSYLIEVRREGKDMLKDQVYVAIGKTVKLDVGDKV